MNRLKKFCIIILLVFTGHIVKAADAESGGMFHLILNKQFNDYFNINIQNHLWLEQNFTRMERYMIGANFKTSIIKKHLFFDVYYYYRYRNINGHSENTQRIQFGFSGGYTLPRVKFSGVSKMESNFVVISANDPFNIYFWRNRLAINGILKNNDKVSPFCAVEVFNQLNWREEFNRERGYENKKGVERLWIDLGVDYKINKTFLMTFTIREQIALFSQRYSTMFGVGCVINL